MKNKFRCVHCNKLKPQKLSIWVPWHRSINATPSTFRGLMGGVCKPCVKLLDRSKPLKSQFVSLNAHNRKNVSY
jgi:hypothetical protein